MLTSLLCSVSLKLKATWWFSSTALRGWGEAEKEGRRREKKETQERGRKRHRGDGRTEGKGED